MHKKKSLKSLSLYKIIFPSVVTANHYGKPDDVHKGIGTNWSKRISIGVNSESTFKGLSYVKFTVFSRFLSTSSEKGLYFFLHFLHSLLKYTVLDISPM